jgi:hypothetical protein
VNAQVKELVATLQKINKGKYDGLMTKVEMIDHIISFMYSTLKPNDWTMGDAYACFGIRDIYELEEFDEERLEGILHFIDFAFKADCKYAPI